MTKLNQRRLGVITTLMMLFFGCFVFSKTNTLEASATPTIAPMATPIIPPCFSELSLNCLERPTLATDSNGQGAYYFLNGVYVQFPSNWIVQPVEHSNSVFRILPSSDSPEGLNIIDFKFTVFTNMNMEQNRAFISTQNLDHTIWKHLVSINDFQGVEFLWGDSDSAAVLEISLYNERDQIAVDVQALITGHPIIIPSDDVANEIFPNIQHIIESIQVWKRATINEHQIGISITNNTGHKNPP